MLILCSNPLLNDALAVIAALKLREREMIVQGVQIEEYRVTANENIHSFGYCQHKLLL